MPETVADRTSALRRGDGCPMCGRGADETPHGVRIFGGLGGRLPRPLSRPTRLCLCHLEGSSTSPSRGSSRRGGGGFWSEVARVAGADVETVRPAKMNWFSLGNGVPHLHVHLVPRPRRRPGRGGRSSRRRSTSPPRRRWGRRTTGGRRARRAGWALSPPRLARTERGVTPGVELLAEGRTAEVFAYGEGRVLKLDRPDWTGLSAFEATVLERAGRAGLPVARPHGAVTVEGAAGSCSTESRGRRVLEVLASRAARVVDLSGHFAGLQVRSTGRQSAGPAPDLVSRLRERSSRAWPTVSLQAELLRCSDALETAGGGLPLRLPSRQRVGRSRRLGGDRLDHGGGGAFGGRFGPHARHVGAAATGPVRQFLRAVRRTAGPTRPWGTKPSTGGCASRPRPGSPRGSRAKRGRGYWGWRRGRNRSSADPVWSLTAGRSKPGDGERRSDTFQIG